MNKPAKRGLSPYLNLLAAIALSGRAEVPITNLPEGIPMSQRLPVPSWQGTPWSRFRTFAWRSPAAHGNESAPGWDNQIFGRRVARAVGAGLTARGYQSVPPARADFIVTYGTARRERRRGPATGSGCRTGPRAPDQDAVSGPRVQDTLLLDVIDAHTGHLVWRGWSSGMIDRNHMDTGTVHGVVDAVLKGIPPR